MKDTVMTSEHNSMTHNCRETALNQGADLYISCREYTRSPMMFSFKPVGINLPVDVNDVTFLQGELSEEGNDVIRNMKENPFRMRCLF